MLYGNRRKHVIHSNDPGKAQRLCRAFHVRIHIKHGCGRKQGGKSLQAGRIRDTRYKYKRMKFRMGSAKDGRTPSFQTENISFKMLAGGGGKGFADIKARLSARVPHMRLLGSLRSCARHAITYLIRFRVFPSRVFQPPEICMPDDISREFCNLQKSMRTEHRSRKGGAGARAYGTEVHTEGSTFSLA